MRGGIVGLWLAAGVALAPGHAEAAEPAHAAPRVLTILGDDLLRLDAAVTAVALSADGRVGALGGRTGVDVFEVPGLRRLRFFPDLVAQERGLALSADGALLAASVSAHAEAIRRKASKHEVDVWNLREGKRVATLDPAIEVQAAAFSPDGRLLAVGGANLGIELWDVAKGRARWRKLAHGANGEILSLAFSPDGRRLLSGAKVGIAGGGAETDEWMDTLRLWNVDTAAQIRPLGEGMSIAGFSADGRFIIDGGGAGAAVFRADADEPFVVLPHFADPKQSLQFVEGAALSADGARAATAGSDGALATWDVGAGRELERVAAHRNMIDAFAASADLRYGLTGSRDQRARLWQLAPLREIPARRGHDGVVMALAVSTDGARLWSLGAEGRAIEWTLATGEIAAETIVDATKPAAGGFTHAAIGGFARGGAVVVALDRDRAWAIDRATGRTLWERKVPDLTYWVPPVAGGSVVAVGAPLLDVATGAQTATIAGGGFHALSPDGRLVAADGADGALRLADARNGATIRALAGHGPSRSFVAGQGFVTDPHAAVLGGAFRPDGAVLVTTGWDHTARFWRVATGEAVGVVSLSAASSPPRAVAFSPDGRRAVVAEEETGLLRLVDGATFREVTSIELAADPRLTSAHPRSIAFSPDGRSLYVGMTRGQIAVVAVP